MKRLLSNSTGMGLVEVLVAIGLLGGLSLVVTHLMTNSQKSVEHLENSSDMLTTVQGIQSLLANPLNCTASFAGKVASNHQNTVNFLHKTTPAGGFINDFKTITADPKVVYGQKQLKIKSYSLSDASEEVSVGTLNTTNLLVEFDRGRSGFRKLVSKKIPLKVEVDSNGKIISCVALSHASDNIWSYAANNVDIFYGAGNVGIGVSNPRVKLDVAGEIRLESKVISPCNASLEGTIRYNKNTREMEYCGGNPLAWKSMNPSSHGITCNWNGVKTNSLNIKDGSLRGGSVCFRVTCTAGKVTNISMGTKNEGYGCGG